MGLAAGGQMQRMALLHSVACSVNTTSPIELYTSPISRKTVCNWEDQKALWRDLHSKLPLVAVTTVWEDRAFSVLF